MIATRYIRQAALPVAATLLALVIAGCSMGGGAPAGGGLAAGLTARMDQPGASLNKADALGIINAYRATTGMAPLVADAGLEGTAQVLANQYAQTGTPPKTPQGLAGMKLSAGYANFADTFSGWRNNPADAAGLRANATKAGIAVAYNGTSTYGVHWVLVLGN